MAHPTSTPEIVRDAAKEFLLLAQTLTEAEAVQWTAAPVPKPREDVVRSAGGHGDPTGDTVLDERRLAVREQVTQALARLTTTAETVRSCREALTAELARYHGEDD